jgi:formamidopyrimidine-DNA glycosylase
MPELAEVFLFSRQWDAGIGRPIVSVQLNSKSRVFRGCDVAVVKTGLRGATLKGSLTHGKQMLFEFGGGRWLGVHLGMTGELRAEPEPYAPVKHDHLVLHAGRVALVFHDPRQFGVVKFFEGKSPPDFWRALPPQPMDDAFTPERVAEILQRHARQPLKALLLDQRYFPGIGNWMADEVLWRMKLPPHIAGGALTAKQARDLWRALRKVCDGALTTIGVDGSDPPRTWLFTHRWTRDSDCPRCGAKLVHETVRGRTACWCPVCQRKGGGKAA